MAVEVTETRATVIPSVGPPVRRRRRGTVPLALLGTLLVGGCDALDSGSSAAPSQETARPWQPRSAPPPSKVIASNGQEGAVGEGYRALPAFAPDDRFARGDLVHARRLVYRLTPRVPEAFGPSRRAPIRPSAELVVDVSEARLRARFQGEGWPVADGAEVRLRRDQPGVYVFDARGGRPLGPGQMAAWFEGGQVHRYPRVHIRGPKAEAQEGPGNLICRLLAEWANHPTDTLERRCGKGGAPPAFRLGPWRADRTADVAFERPASSLRADHRDPPDRPSSPDGPVSLTSLGLERLRPFFELPAEEPGPRPVVVRNDGSARALIVIEGAPVGWLEAGEQVTFELPTAGMYRLGAMRPLGSAALREKRVRVPGELTLTR